MTEVKYKNGQNLPLSVAVWLVHDEYQYNDAVNTFSATTIMDPIRQIILKERAMKGVKKTSDAGDIINRIPTTIGTAMHDGIERAWLRGAKEGLQKLGVPKRVIANILINPEAHEITEDSIVVWMEQRLSKTVIIPSLTGDSVTFTVTGQFDFVMDGQLEDHKSGSTYGYTNNSNKEKFPLQGSIYRWLDPKKITSNKLVINNIFTDWSGASAKQNPTKYPQHRILSQEFDLMSVPDTERYLTEKLKAIVKYREMPENLLPQCSDDDLWVKPTVYKYFKNPAGKRATKNFDNYHDAQFHMVTKCGSVGEIKTVKGMVGKCNYCIAAPTCSQRQLLEDTGRLIYDPKF